VPPHGSTIGTYIIESGSKVGPYTIGRKIGGGNFGQVYEAVSAAGRQVALKVIHRTRSIEIEAEERGARLQQAFGATQGTVPEVYDIDSDADYFYIAMELVQAPTLEQVIQAGSIVPDVAAAHARALCGFLEKLHAFTPPGDAGPYRAVVHADLKPPHVFVLANDRIKVCDFGIAKALTVQKPGTVVRGWTPQYSPPERFDDPVANEFDDLWAVGVMLYEEVSGHRPYLQEELRGHLRRAIRNNDPREPLPPSCPRRLEAIINKLLAFAQDARYKSAAAVRQDLELYLAGKEPAALRQLQTPQTVVRQGHAPARAVPRSAPTIPRPLSPREVAVAAPPTQAVPSRRAVLASHVAWAAVLVAGMTFFTTEAVAWMRAEELRTEIARIDGPRIAALRLNYYQLSRWTLWGIGRRLRLDGPLQERLVALADEVARDYRQTDPTVREAQWRHCRDAMMFAGELEPGDSSLLPRELVCGGHLDRIARNDAAAMAKFRRAAGLAPQSADPHLGLSRVYLEDDGVEDVEQGVAALEEAERRGYERGWRDTASIGHAYRTRAAGTQKLLGNLARLRVDAANRPMAERVRDDYSHCVAALETIPDKARDELRDCRRALNLLNAALAVAPSPEPAVPELFAIEPVASEPGLPQRLGGVAL
jgi:hypothetical protein